MILYMYIAPGQGQKTPWGQTFDVQGWVANSTPGIFQWNLPEYSGLENMPKVANMENMILVL